MTAHLVIVQYRDLLRKAFLGYKPSQSYMRLLSSCLLKIHSTARESRSNSGFQVWLLKEHMQGSSCRSESFCESYQSKPERRKGLVRRGLWEHLWFPEETTFRSDFHLQWWTSKRTRVRTRVSHLKWLATVSCKMWQLGVTVALDRSSKESSGRDLVP